MKKIITIALAVAVLFAFAACQQAIPTNNNVKMITAINQIGEFVEGQDFDASKFEVVLLNTDNTETVLSGKGFVTAAGWDSGDYEVTASVSVSGVTDPLTFSVEADVYQIEGISVVVPEDPVYSNDDLADLVSADGIKSTLSVSVIYNVDQELELAADEYTLTDNGNKTITVAETMANEFTYTYEFDMPTPEVPDTTRAGIVATVTSADDYYGTSATVAINYVNAAGEQLDTVTASDYYIIDSESALVEDFSGITLGETAVTYTVRMTTNPYWECEVVIPAGENYITNVIGDLNVIVADSEKAWSAGDSVAVADFKIDDELTYAITGNTTTDDYVEFTVSEAGSDFRLAQGNNTIHYQIQYCLKGVEGETAVKTLTINVQ